MYTEHDFPNHLRNQKKLTFEERLGKYKNRMELMRTAIGVIVLVIQIIILHHLLTK